MTNNQKLELTWIGKENQPRLEPRILIEDQDVQEKTQAALEYCKYATGFTTQNSGKPWKYILIPHNAVQANMSFEYLVKNFECEG